MSLNPLMDMCVRVAAAAMYDGNLGDQVQQLYISGSAMWEEAELFDRIAKAVTMQNVKVVLFGLAAMPNIKPVKNARDLVRKWLAKEWLNMKADGGFVEWNGLEKRWLAKELGIAVVALC